MALEAELSLALTVTVAVGCDPSITRNASAPFSVTSSPLEPGDTATSARSSSESVTRRGDTVTVA